MLHQVGDLFELNVKLRCQKVKRREVRRAGIEHARKIRAKFWRERLKERDNFEDLGTNGSIMGDVDSIRLVGVQ